MVVTARVLVRPSVIFTLRRTLSDKRDCPLCQRLGRGPCGDIFWKWWECTERNPEGYVKSCDLEFRQLQQCLEAESDYYDNDNGEDEGKVPLTSLRTAWEELIENDLRQTTRSNFPSGFSPRRNGPRSISIQRIIPDFGRLVLAYVVTFPGGKLVAAAALSDMLHRSDGSMLFELPSVPIAMKICAVYETESEQLSICEEVLLNAGR